MHYKPHKTQHCVGKNTTKKTTQEQVYSSVPRQSTIVYAYCIMRHTAQRGIVLEKADKKSSLTNGTTKNRSVNKNERKKRGSSSTHVLLYRPLIVQQYSSNIHTTPDGGWEWQSHPCPPREMPPKRMEFAPSSAFARTPPARRSLQDTSCSALSICSYPLCHGFFLLSPPPLVQPAAKAKCLACYRYVGAAS